LPQAHGAPADVERERKHRENHHPPKRR
jgi:hypothetical protein